MENSSVDLKSLWARQATPPPAPELIYEKINDFQRKNRVRLIKMNALFIATSTFIIFVWIKYQPESLSTKTGIVLIIVAMVMSLLTHNKSFSLYRTIDSGKSNEAYLQRLVAIRKRERFLQTTIQTIYFILLTAGVSLYLYEYTLRMDAMGAALTYGLTIGWILMGWFYFRPRQIKKQRNRLHEVISKLEELNAQLKIRD